MNNTKENGNLAIPFAMDRNTGATVLLRASGTIQPDSVFYNKDVHKGHLTCPKCEIPDIYANEATEVAGGMRVRRDYFARYPKQAHGSYCEWEYLDNRTSDSHRVINFNKGGYFYLNTGKLPDRPPYRDVFKRLSSKIPDEMQTPPTWIISINYQKALHDSYSITNPDFKDRPRLKPASTVEKYINTICSIPEKNFKDTWIINRRVAVRLDKAILRVGNVSSQERSSAELITHSMQAGLKSSFLMAANPNYDRFASLLNTERENIRHPVLLHFKVEANPKKTTQDNETFWRIRLAPFFVENPERKKTQPHHLALPFSKVQPLVNIYDETIAEGLKLGDEFFAIAHPNLSVAQQDTPNRLFFQHFNIVRISDIIQMTQVDLAEKIRKAANDRRMREERNALKQNIGKPDPS